MQWTVDAYTLVLASLLMLSGSAADRFGRRRVFRTGLVLFSAGSLACALAPGLGLLVAFRVFQAIGGAMLSPSAMAIVGNTFAGPRERAQAIGVFAAMFGISMALGPVLGGFLVSAASWRAVFLVSLPVGLAAIVLAARFVPESLSPRPRRFDPAGQVLVIAALAALTYAVIEGGRAGFGTARIVIVLTVAAGCLAGLMLWGLRRGEPLLEVRLFTSAPFAGASAIAVCLSAALGGFLFMNTLYLQDVRGLPALHAGLTMLPTAAMVIVFAPVSGRLTGRFGARPGMCAGGLAVAASGLMLTGLAPRTQVPYVLGAYAVFGLGFALASPPIASTAVSAMPPAQAGVASAVATTSRQVGLTLGVAVSGAVAGDSPDGQIGRGFAHATTRVVDRGRSRAHHRSARLPDDHPLGTRHRPPRRAPLRRARPATAAADDRNTRQRPVTQARRDSWPSSISPHPATPLPCRTPLSSEAHVFRIPELPGHWLSCVI